MFVLCIEEARRVRLNLFAFGRNLLLLEVLILLGSLASSLVTPIWPIDILKLRLTVFWGSLGRLGKP